MQVLAAPSILVIGTDGKATLLTGYVDAAVVRQTVGDARRDVRGRRQGQDRQVSEPSGSTAAPPSTA